MRDQAKGVREIASAQRNKGGRILGFTLRDRTALNRKQAVAEARQGRLVGINLYPGFVKDVVSPRTKEGLLRRIVKAVFEKK